MVKILLQAVEGKNPRLPQYKSAGSSGADVCACLDEPVIIESGQTTLIPTGFRIAIPVSYEAQIRPRSGLALEYGITLLNTPGTIDCDYRGEVKIIVSNFGDKDFTINDGDRIAQMVIAPVSRAEFELVKNLPSTDRGFGGFGHTGRR